MTKTPNVLSVTLEPGRQYVLFVDPSCVSLRELAPLQETGQLLVVPVMPRPGQSVEDVLVMTRLEQLQREYSSDDADEDED